MKRHENSITIHAAEKSACEMIVETFYATLLPRFY